MVNSGLHLVVRLGECLSKAVDAMRVLPIGQDTTGQYYEQYVDSSGLVHVSVDSTVGGGGGGGTEYTEDTSEAGPLDAGTLLWRETAPGNEMRVVGTDDPLPVNVVAGGTSGGATEAKQLASLPGTIDTFGRVITGQRSNHVEIQFYLFSQGGVDISYLSDFGTVTENSGGTISARLGGAEFSTNGGANGEAGFVTSAKTQYHAGGEVYCDVTASFTTAVNAGDTSRQIIGLFDGNNGLWIGYQNDSWGVGYRNNATDTFVPQASFNGDPLDGSASSEFTRGGSPEAIVLGYVNVFRIRFGWLGTAPIKWEVLAPDGNYVVMHTLKWPNFSTDPHIRNADLPISCEVFSDNASAAGVDYTIYTNCWGAGLTATPVWLPIDTVIDASPDVGQVPLASLTRALVMGESSAQQGLFVNMKVTGSGAVNIEGSVTADTELPAAAALSDAISNPTTPTVGAAGLLWDATGGAWARASSDEGAPGVGTQRIVEADYDTSIETNGTLVAELDATTIDGSTYDQLLANSSNDTIYFVSILNDSDQPIEVGFRDSVANAAGDGFIGAFERRDFWFRRDHKRLVNDVVVRAVGTIPAAGTIYGEAWLST